MNSSFSADFPTWLVQPAVLANVMENQYFSLQNIPSAISVPDLPLFLTGLKQALFWRRRLAPTATNHTVIFSFLGVRGLSLPNVLEVCQALKGICNMSQMVEVYRAPNSPFIGISFSDISSVNLFQSLCHSYKDFFVFTVSPSSMYSHNFKLLGLPPLFHDSRIHHFLNKYSIHHNFTRDRVTTDVNIHTPLNSVSGSLQLSPSQDISLIPHLIPLPSPHLGSALFIISGRKPLCLKCGDIGHIRRFCTSVKCSLCHRFHASTALCSSSNSLLDPSIIGAWLSEDSACNAPTTVSPSFSSESLECNGISKSPSPNASSSPPPIPSFAQVASTGSTSNITSVSPILAENIMTSSSTNIPMPSNLFCPSSTTPHVTTPLSSSSHAASLRTSFQLFDKKREAIVARIQAKKDALSAKRNHSRSSSSSSSSKHHCSTENIYSALEDEVHSISKNLNLNDIAPISTVNTDNSVPAQSSSPISHQSQTHSLDTPSTIVLTYSHGSFNKKAKKHKKSTSATSFISAASVPSHTSHLLNDSSTSWGDRMEEENNLSTTPLPHPVLLTSSNLASQVLLTSTNIAVSSVSSSNVQDSSSIALDQSTAPLNFDRSSSSSLHSSSSIDDGPIIPSLDNIFKAFPPLSDVIDGSMCFNLSLFFSSSDTLESHCYLFCSVCLTKFDLEWPILEELSCNHCSAEISYPFHHQFLPSPSHVPIILYLSDDHLSNMANVDYLKLCLAHQVLIRVPLP